MKASPVAFAALALIAGIVWLWSRSVEPVLPLTALDGGAAGSGSAAAADAVRDGMPQQLPQREAVAPGTPTDASELSEVQRNARLEVVDEFGEPVPSCAPSGYHPWPMATRKPSPDEEPLSSTLRHVKAVQRDGDDDLSWTNLHDKMVRWVAEATQGQNLPADKSIDDLTQEVLLQVFRDIGEFRVEPGASFSGWVRMIAHRKFNDYWRRGRAKKRGGGKLKHLGDFDETGGRDHFADERTPRQSMLVRFGELRDGVEKALAELGDKHKKVLELRLFQGKSFAEIMPILGYTKEVTVRSLHMRALQRLQELLQPFDA